MPAPPYDSVNTVLNAARTRANDAIASLGGDVLANTQAFTQQYTNNAWRRLQEFLANLGYTTLNREITISSIPAQASADPNTQNWMDWSGYFDGVVLHPTLVIPQDCTLPLLLYERISGQNLPFLAPMENMVDGLKQWYGTSPIYNYQWTWREDKIFVPGCLSTTDWRLKYARFMPDFATLSGVAISAASKTNPCNITSAGSGVISGETITISGATGTGWTGLNTSWVVTVLDDNTFSIPLDASAFTGTVGGSPVLASVTWSSRPVPIMRCLDAFAWYILYEATEPRGDVDRNEILQMAEGAASRIMNRDIRQKQRVNIRRQSRSGRLEGNGAGFGSGWY